jgi:hypothetical protein
MRDPPPDNLLLHLFPGMVILHLLRLQDNHRVQLNPATTHRDIRTDIHSGLHPDFCTYGDRHPNICNHTDIFGIHVRRDVHIHFSVQRPFDNSRSIIQRPGNGSGCLKLG